MELYGNIFCKFRSKESFKMKSNLNSTQLWIHSCAMIIIGLTIAELICAHFEGAFVMTLNVVALLFFAHTNKELK